MSSCSTPFVTIISIITRAKKAEVLCQMVEHLPSKHKALILNPTTEKQKTKNKRSQEEKKEKKKRKEICALSSSPIFKISSLWKGHLAYS
jgi:hypothetical protein